MGALSDFRSFGAFGKVEEQADGTIKVFGIASSEAVDNAGETIKASAMSEALPDYEIYPALREMHSLSAAGTTLELTVDDDGFTRICAHVVDEAAIKKVKTKTYRGFSIGGKVLARDPTDRSIITKIKLNEISLVDRPCNPDATLDMWKADAATGDQPMTDTAGAWSPKNTDVVELAKTLATEAGKPKRFNDFIVKARDALIAVREADELARAEAAEAEAAEVVAKAEVEAALAEGAASEPAVAETVAAEAVVEPVAGEPGPDAGVAAEKAAITEPVTAEVVDPVAALEAAIEKAAAAVTGPVEAVIKPALTEGLDDMAKACAELAKGEPSTDPLAKGLYTVAWLARVLEELAMIQSSAEWETLMEGDASSVATTLAEQIKALGATLLTMAQEEVAELVSDGGGEFDVIDVDFAYASKIVDLVKADTDLMAKAGARNSKKDATKLQAIHDNSLALGATCGDAEKAVKPEDLAKVLSDNERLTAVIAKATTALDDVTAKVGGLQDRIAHLESQPAAPKAMTADGLVAISKVADVQGVQADPEAGLLKAAFDAMSDADKGELMVKIALKRPHIIDPRGQRAA